MESKNSHSQTVDKQFGSQAQDYLTSAVHSQGPDLQRLATMLQSHPDARVIDLGCGAGHASFVAAKAVKEVVAYDLSAQMLEVVSQAAKMEAAGKDVHYFENIEGGHGAGSTSEQTAKTWALNYTFLWDVLGKK